MARRIAFVRPMLFVLSAFVSQAQAQSPVPYERLLSAGREPQNWLTYNGTYDGHRYSTLTQITPENAKDLQMAWAYQAPVAGSWQPSPLVVDGIMYLTQRPNDIVALDAATGAVFWVFRYNSTNPSTPACCGSENRGLAILGDTLFEGTLDAHLIAVDARSGDLRWNVEVGNSNAAYALSLAPLVIKDKVIVGIMGGEYGVRGFIAAYDARTGKEVWRFNTIPGPGEPGHETWEPCPQNSKTYCDPDAWQHGGGSIWITGSYDPELNLTYWGVGNASPDLNNLQRPGDNLYTSCVVALDPDTGKLKWHYQFSPNDSYDWDADQIGILVDMTWQGAPLKAILWAHRNGYFYVLDRRNGAFLLAKPFTRTNWASGFDTNGRPTRTSRPPGAPTFPSIQGGTNWYSPSYSPRTQLMYLGAWEDYGGIFTPAPQVYKEGQNFMGGTVQSFVPADDTFSQAIPGAPGLPGLRRGPINNWTETAGHGSILAIDPTTGTPTWRFPMTDVPFSGIVSTASDVLFVGTRDGDFEVLDARTGKLLWNRNLGGQLDNATITYSVKGRQYVSTIAATTLFTFALPGSAPTQPAGGQ
jgi:alcohol dehydrogenase (cytochrome c)